MEKARDLSLAFFIASGVRNNEGQVIMRAGAWRQDNFGEFDKNVKMTYNLIILIKKNYQ